ncbi:MAG: hypothetical protein JNG83_02800 [Opitutaceae bacterium]|nr:hypothetical protein [Opitutaceae bacterium]
MRISLIIEALTAPQGEILHQVAAALRRLPELPETLVWSLVPGELEARVWLILNAEPAQIDGLAAELRKVPGVMKVVLDEPPAEAAAPPPSGTRG